MGGGIDVAAGPRMVKNSLAGVAVSDLERAVDWYTSLLGHKPHSRPMPEVAEWRFDDGGWLQVFIDRERAGSSSVTFVETSVDNRLKTLAMDEIPVAKTSLGSSMKTAIVNDLDGNQIVFAEAVGALPE